MVRLIFANMAHHVHEHEIRGWWLRACDVLPPQLGRSSGAARNIRRHAVDDKAELNKNAVDDTPVVMCVWRVNGVFPTVRQHDFMFANMNWIACPQILFANIKAMLTNMAVILTNRNGMFANMDIL